MKTRYFDIARRIAVDNPSDFKMAAIFVPRTGHQYWAGKNTIFRTHPMSQTLFKNIHAELAALINYGLWNVEGIKGGEMYVLRIADYGLALARPCDECETLLRKFQLKRVHYTTKFGYETLKLRGGYHV